MSSRNSNIFKDSTNRVIHALYSDIKRGIELTFNEECYSSSVALIYIAIDSLASIVRHPKQAKVQRKDFIRWVERYLVIEGAEQISGEEFYSARCGVLHSLSSISGFTKNRKARMICYQIDGYPPVRYEPTINKQLLILDIRVLKDAFFNGLDRFITEIFSNHYYKDIPKSMIEERLNSIFCIYQVK